MGIGDLVNPSPVPESRATSRDLYGIPVRGFGRPLRLLMSRTSMPVVVPEFPRKGLVTGPGRTEVSPDVVG